MIDRVKRIESPLIRDLSIRGIFYMACCTMIAIELILAIESGVVAFLGGFKCAYKHSYTPDIFNRRLKEGVLKKLLTN